MNPKPDYIIHANKVHALFSHNGLEGYRPEDVTLPVVDKIPAVLWTGGRIPVALWREVLAFFKWSYDTTKSEVQVRLFYNPKTKEWKAHAFPQEKGTSLAAREIEKHPNREEDMALFKGWRMWGTVHHHCSIGAFQSGTDRTDEESQAGIHITVGHMDKPEHDLHSRVSVIIPGELNEAGDAIVRPAQKLFLEPNLIDWFALNTESSAHIPVELHPIVLKHYLTRAATADEKFPDRWKDNVIEVPRQSYVHINGPGAYHGPMAIMRHQGYFDNMDKHEFVAGTNVRASRPAQPQHTKGIPFTDEEMAEAWEQYMGGPNPHKFALKDNPLDVPDYQQHGGYSHD